MLSSNSLRINFNYFPNSYLSSSSSSFSGQFSLQINPTKSLPLILNAGKKDNHSFVPKSDEVTGFFPESVLLKKKEVEEDGKLLPEFEDADERELYESLKLDVETDMDVELLRHYEIVYLIHEDHEEEVAAVNEKVQDFLREKKGRVWRFSDWGMRSLAYKIQKANNAHYILMNFELDAKYIDEFKTMLDKDERVIRHLVMKKDEAITEDCPPPPEFNTLAANIDDEDDEEWDDEDEEDDYDDDEEEEEEEEDDDDDDDDDDDVEDDDDVDDDDIEEGEGIFIVDDDDLEISENQKIT
ncbi:Translation elongation factor EF1B/ribosomal protein S6 family protein [Trifolium repens]|nr:Translation elongation factor EF1B/ribosomal protein S6 family protein [Trifolium repens]